MDITERLLDVPTMGHDAGCVMEAAEEIKRLRAAIVWALGAGDEFKPQGTMDGKYWWRGELASRAGMQWNGDKYVTAPPRNGPACNLLRPWEEVASSKNLPEVPTCTKSQTDAERYRWLRGGSDVPSHSVRWPRWEVRNWDGRHWQTLFAEQMDSAIDAAMSKDLAHNTNSTERAR